MTAPQIQIACAKACEWEEIHENVHKTQLLGYKRIDGELCDDEVEAIPSYTTSHDAMAEALGTMTEEEWWEYLRALANEFGGSLDSWSIAVLKATPLQQAVAFLKTKNLYTQ